MKKYILIILAFISLLMSGCGEDDLSSLTSYILPEYNAENEWNNPETDPEITIDGMMDEEIWKQVQGNEVVFSSKVSEDIQMSTVTYLGEKGVYFGIVVKDSGVYYSPDRRASRNSGAEIYVNEYGKYLNDIYTFSFRLVPTGKDGEIYTETYIYDRNGETSIWIARHLAASTVQGIINTSSCEGYTIELFIPYETLNITEECDCIQYFPAFNHVESMSSEGERTRTGYPNCKTQFPYSWLVVSNEKVENHKELHKVVRARDEYMNIDGNLTEEEWIETYKYQVTENQVTTETTIYSHFGEKGL